MVDTTIPVITLAGIATVDIEVGSTYTDDGATALDNYDGGVTSSIVIVNPVDETTVGTYTVTYNVSDSNGNPAVQVTRTVNVVDTTAPVITLTGDEIITIEVGSTYADAGAIAKDNYDNDTALSTNIITVNTVDTNIVASYTLTYNVTDANGNAAVQVIRTVNVVDTTVPVITLTGNATVTIEVGKTYTDQGTTALDNFDGDITSSIVEVSTVETSIVGVYTVTYNVTDANGNSAVEVTRTVSIVDTTAPVIALTGEPIVTIEVGKTYTEQGAIATDNYDTTLAVVVEGDTVDTAIVGIYTVTYNASDSNGNEAAEVTRTVTVKLVLDSTEINSVNIYPNPTTSEWNIESLTIINTVTLFNLLGQKVLEQTVNDTKVNIDASNLSTGVYMLRVNKTIIKRVFKR